MVKESLEACDPDICDHSDMIAHQGCCYPGLLGYGEISSTSADDVNFSHRAAHVVV